MRFGAKIILVLKRLWQLAVFIGFAVFLVAITLHFSADERKDIVGVAHVIDGDSLDINGQKIRLKGIDAPEFLQTCQKDNAEWSCGQDAREALKAHMGGGFIRCVAAGRDKYRRILARCEAKGRDLGQWMVINGWAVAYGDYELDEVLARKNRSGIWIGTFERPQDWRRRSGVAEMSFDLFSWIQNLFH